MIPRNFLLGPAIGLVPVYLGLNVRPDDFSARAHELPFGRNRQTSPDRRDPGGRRGLHPEISLSITI